jgi:hypothetical protein
MTPHLTENQLIKYNFNLSDPAETENIATHLNDCSRCREALEKLKTKFASLDLLAGKAGVSEDLIAKTLAGVKKTPRTKIIPLPVWITAAAAVLIMGISILLNTPGSEKTRSLRQLAKDIPAKREKFDFDFKSRIAADEVADMRAVAVVAEKPAPLKSEEFAAGLISEQPPFAPASAIELVTLPRRDNVQITIYNSADLTLVREQRNLTLKTGWNWLQFMWANTLIDPTSLNLQPLDHADKIDIQQLVYPARLKDVGRWLIRSEVTGQVPFEITYFTSGLSWRAFYMGTLTGDEKSMTLAGYVRVSNHSGEDYEDARTRLIVGQIHLLDKIADLAKRKYPYESPAQRIGWFLDAEEDATKYDYDDKSRLLGDTAGVGGAFYGLKAPKQIQKQGLSEYFLYTIEGTETIPNTWSKRLPSFEIEDIPVKSLYKYDEDRYGGRTIRYVSFANDENHELGQTPIPNGAVKIYRTVDEEKNLSYVGGTSIKYIPVDEDIELNLGSARLVSVEPVLMDFKTENILYDYRGNITGWDEVRTWKIKTINTRKLPVDVEITRNFNTTCWTMRFDEKNISCEKHDASHARFELTLEPRTKREFTYTVTTYHGDREQSFNSIIEQSEQIK